MNVIFLDIDGVLQPVSSQKRFEYNLLQLQTLLGTTQHYDFFRIDKYDIGAVFYDWLPLSVEYLRKLLKIFDAKIVVSSNWRTYNSLHFLKLLFSIYDLDDYIYDLVPEFLSDRFEEIVFYVKNKPEVEKFIILDDARPYGDLKAVLEPYFVEVDRFIDEQVFQKAIDKFKNQTKFQIPENIIVPEIVWTSKKITSPKIRFFNGAEIFIAKIGQLYYIFKFQHLSHNGSFRRLNYEFSDLTQAIKTAESIF